jgi:hypothetical protein
LSHAIAARLVWAVVVLGALVVLFRGLMAGFYFEPTEEALAEARSGAILVGAASVVLVAAAAYAVRAEGWPRWVAGGVLAPVVLCGGLTWLASETLFAQLAVVVAYPAALAAVVAGVVLGARR